MENVNLFDKIAYQADQAKASMGPNYGLDVTDLSEEQYIAHLKTKIRKRA